MSYYNSKTISLPKYGNTNDENEDNYSFSKYKKKKRIHFAISDGATESSFSKEWSFLLVEEYKSGNDPFSRNHLQESLSKLSKEWHSNIQWKELPWYAQQKVETGASATFLGLTIEKRKKCFNTIAMGDCCLFHIRKEKLLFSFPVLSSQDFGNTPNLFANNPTSPLNIDEVRYSRNRKLLSNDILLLATDALSIWIFKQIENKERPWNTLNHQLSDNGFASLVYPDESILPPNFCYLTTTCKLW